MASNDEIRPYSHSICEALNKILAEKLFKVQDVQELNDGPSWPGVSGPHPEKVSLRWVKHLYGLVDELNDMETEMIGMKPKDAIELNEVPLVDRESYPPEDILPEDGLYRYLLQPGEEPCGSKSQVLRTHECEVLFAKNFVHFITCYIKWRTIMKP